MKGKVLLFLKFPPPLTGATLMNKYVSESKLLNEHYDFYIIPVSYKSEIEDVTIYSLKKIGTVIKIYCKLLYSIIHFKPDFIYFQISPLGLAFYRDCSYVFLIKILHRHIIFHLHGKGINEVVLKSKIKRIIYSWAFKNSSIICLSDKLTFDINEVYNQKPYIVNNAIPVQHCSNINNVKDGTINLLFLSNLIISKGIYVFLDSLTLIKNLNLNKIKGYIVGKEVEIKKKELSSEIEKRNLQDIVQFLGPQYNNEKNEILNHTDILIYPTYNDVWGLVILEAMQFGIPVIASREGAIPEIVDDGVTGFLVDKHSPEQIAEKLEILSNDALLREKMGRSARIKFLEKYTLDIFENRMKEVFDAVLEKLENR